jgi:hypothetical protein
MAYSFPLGQKSLAPAQLFLCLLALTDIDDNSRKKAGLAFGNRQVDGANIRPNHATVFASEASFHTIISPPPSHSLRSKRFVSRTVLFYCEVQAGKSVQFVLGVSEHFLKCKICGK